MEQEVIVEIQRWEKKVLEVELMERNVMMMMELMVQ